MSVKNMSKNKKSTIKRSMIKERMKASDLNTLNIQYTCEQCVYFMDLEATCNLGFKTNNHTRQEQKRSYNMSGHVRFCRFLEID